MSTMLPLQNLNQTLASYYQKKALLLERLPLPLLSLLYVKDVLNFYFCFYNNPIAVFFVGKIETFFIFTQFRGICSGWYLSVGWHCYALVGQFRFFNIQAVKNFIPSEMIRNFIDVYTYVYPPGGRPGKSFAEQRIFGKGVWGLWVGLPFGATYPFFG